MKAILNGKNLFLNKKGGIGNNKNGRSDNK